MQVLEAGLGNSRSLEPEVYLKREGIVQAQVGIALTTQNPLLEGREALGLSQSSFSCLGPKARAQMPKSEEVASSSRISI